VISLLFMRRFAGQGVVLSYEFKIYPPEEMSLITALTQETLAGPPDTGHTAQDTQLGTHSYLLKTGIGMWLPRVGAANRSL